MADVRKIEELQGEYADAIDTSTLLAILSDFDLFDEAQLGAARDILDQLRAAAITEQESGFDPSGASGTAIIYEECRHTKDESESVQGWKSQTDSTSLSLDFSSLDLEGAEQYSGSLTSKQTSLEGSPYASTLDVLDLEAKEATLTGMFPALKPYDIKWALKKFKGNADLALDELMTQSFLEESGTRHRGIEAFSENEASPRPRKGRGKRRRGARGDDSAKTSTTETPIQSKWEMSKRDSELIASKTGIPLQQIATIYHKNGASLSKTILAIAEAHIAATKPEPLDNDPILQIQLFELRQEFPSLSDKDLEALIRITDPSYSNARDLAQVICSRQSIKESRIELSFRHAPVEPLSDPKSRPISHNAVSPDLPLDASAAAHMAATHRNTRDAAFIQASSAYRKGKSNPLMGGAAAYYSQIGRDADARAKAAEAHAADALVAAQSSRLQLDLHGVSVKDAVRIARDKVERWWHELGEDRLGGRKTIGSGYTIVTGIGLHSQGGRSKLGPAVGRMLLAEGWKVEFGTGNIRVSGKTRF